MQQFSLLKNSCDEGVIMECRGNHELPLHSVTKTFSTIGAFQKLNYYKTVKLTQVLLLAFSLRQESILQKVLSVGQ